MMPAADPVSRIPAHGQRNGSASHKRSISAPSKLEQLQRNYQERLLREKEEKLSQMYKEREERNKQQIAKYSYKNNAIDNRTFDRNVGGGAGVRQFLTQNRGGGQSKASAGINGKPPIPFQKTSAGKDRGNPLAPINHGSPNNSGRNRKSDLGVLGGGGSPIGIRHSPKPPGFDKPKLARVQRRGYATPTDSGNESSGYEDQNRNYSQRQKARVIRKPAVMDYQASSGEEDTPAKNRAASFQKWKQNQQTARQRNAGSKPMATHNGYHSEGASNTDFQKWQAQQDAEKAERLQKHREANNANNDDYVDFKSRSPSPAMGKTFNVKKPPLKRQQPRTQTYDSPDEEDAYNSSRSNTSKVSAAAMDRHRQVENELKQKEQELQRMIENQQKELDKMQKLREKEEDEERKQREEEEAKRQKRAKAVTAGQVSQRSRRGSSASRHRDRSPSPAPKSTPTPDVMFKKPAKVQRKPPPKKKATNPLPEPEGGLYYDHSNAAEFYEGAVAADPDAAAVDLDLMPCALCGRKFAAERLAKHQNVCKSATKAAKKRKVFDPVKMRTEGTEMSKFVQEAARKPEPKKANTGDWRKKREDFIKSLRYAKKVTEIEKSGGNVADLPPPPVTENAHYQQCPYCERRFAPETAERHIPKCKDIKARPKAPAIKRRGR